MNDKILQFTNQLRRKKVDAMLVSSAVNIGYLANFFGFSKNEREAFVLITNNNQYLATDGRYIEEVKKTVKGFEIIEITPNNPVKKILKSFIKKQKIKHLGFEKNNLTVSEFERFNDVNHFSKLVPTGNIIEELRAVKNIDEIEAIEKACALGDKTFDYILGKIKPGITEKQLAFEIEFFIKKHGADISFPPIVAFGANSSVPHHQTSDQRLTHSASSGQATTILLDFGVKLPASPQGGNNYCSDMTRTVFLGKATKEQKKIYNTVLRAQNLALEYLSQRKTPRTVARQRPRLLRGGGIKASDIDRVARDYIIKAGYPTIPHSLGHGIGLEVHELPRLSPKSKDKLVPGMVFSIEPGIYLPGFGGVRIEDLVVLEKTSPRILTKAKKEIIEI